MKDIKDKIGIKKIIIAITILIIIIVFFIVGALAYNKYFYKKSYTEIEKIMKDAAIKYYKKNEDRLPTNEGDLITISADELAKEDYMEEISNYLKDDKKKCTGKVTVTKTATDYRYTPSLDCGEDYKVKFFSEYLIEKEKENETKALYEMNNEYVFRGELINNYLDFGEHSWRIVKIKNNKTIIILNEKIKNVSTLSWDDRYNQEKRSQSGINNYELSRANEYLGNIYKRNILLNEEDTKLTTTFDLEIGKRSETDEDKTGTAEKSKVLTNQHIGLLPVYDYLNASTDSNCKSVKTEACSNYNYLARLDENWWTLTGSTSNTYEVYKVSGLESIFATKASNQAQLRPVIALAQDVIYVSGEGSRTNPYKIK